MFVILFGLSMDYHVFILSRIREAFDKGASTDDAVRYGIKSTAGVVTSAAIVMIGVFSIFASLRALEFKQMGVGLAVAVLIDATIVRGVLLPATMKLLGDWNWYLPRKLGWLPRIAHEPARRVARAKIWKAPAPAKRAPVVAGKSGQRDRRVAPKPRHVDRREVGVGYKRLFRTAQDPTVAAALWAVLGAAALAAAAVPVLELWSVKDMLPAFGGMIVLTGSESWRRTSTCTGSTSRRRSWPMEPSRSKA